MHKRSRHLGPLQNSKLNKQSTVSQPHFRETHLLINLPPPKDLALAYNPFCKSLIGPLNCQSPI